MKPFICALLLFSAAALLRAADLAPSPAEEGWSTPVAGLQARLTFGKGTDFNGTHLPEVYLELRNLNNLISPLEFDFDFSKSLHFDLLAADGQPPPPPKGIVLESIDGFSTVPCRLTIPRDGALRFAITWSGFGVMQNAGTMLGFEAALAHWTISPGDPKDYFLHVTLTAPHPAPHSGHDHDWHGSIKIPPAKVPISK